MAESISLTSSDLVDDGVGEGSLSEFWRKNTSNIEATELANLLRALRKVSGTLGRNVLDECPPGRDVEYLNPAANRQHGESLCERPLRQREFHSVASLIPEPQQPAVLLAAQFRRDISATGEEQAVKVLEDGA